MKKRNLIFVPLTVILILVIIMGVMTVNKKNKEKLCAWLGDYEAELTDDLIWEEFKPEPWEQWQKGYRLVSENFHFNVYCGKYRDNNAFEVVFAFLIRDDEKYCRLKFRNGRLEDTECIPDEFGDGWRIVEWALKNGVFSIEKTLCFENTRVGIINAMDVDNWKNYRRHKDDMIQSYNRKKRK